MLTASTRVRALTLIVTASILFEISYSAPTAEARTSPGDRPPVALRTASLGDTVQNGEALSEPDPETGLKPGAIEVVAARTEYSQSFTNLDGTKTTLFYADPTFYQPEGSLAFEPISVGFSPSSTDSADFVSAAAPVAVSVSELAATKNFLATSYKDNTIAFALPASQMGAADSIEPTVSGAVADYQEIQPGIDLRVIAGAHGPKSFFVWHAQPIDLVLRYTVDAPGLTLVSEDDGSIALVDAAGATIATIPHPYAVDSTPNEFTGSGEFTDAVTLSLEPDGKTVDVSVDPTWLKTAVYPVCRPDDRLGLQRRLEHVRRHVRERELADDQFRELPAA